MQCLSTEDPVTVLCSSIYIFTLNLGTNTLNFNHFRDSCVFSSPDDAKIIKVASSSLSAKRFFKGENDTGHTVSVPDRPEDAITKPAMNMMLSLSAQHHTRKDSRSDHMHIQASLWRFSQRDF